MAQEIKNETKEEAPLSIVEEAKKIRDEIKRENDRRQELLQEEQKLHAERLLSGTAGGRVEPEVKPETAKEYADRIMNGKTNKQ